MMETGKEYILHKCLQLFVLVQKLHFFKNLKNIDIFLVVGSEVSMYCKNNIKSVIWSTHIDHY